MFISDHHGKSTPPGRKANFLEVEPIQPKLTQVAPTIMNGWIKWDVPLDNPWVVPAENSENNEEELEEDEMEVDDEEEIDVDDEDEMDDPEIINPYEEVDPLNRPSPNFNYEPVAAHVGRSTLQLLPSIRRFLGTFYVRDGSSATAFIVNHYRSDNEFWILRRFDRSDLRMNSFDDDLTELDSKLREEILSLSKMEQLVANLDDPYVITRDVATVPARGDDDLVAPEDPIMSPKGMTKAAIKKLVVDRVAKAVATNHAARGAVELCRWFKKTESVFSISECVERNKEEFCPIEEILLMKSELWNLRVKDYNITAYTHRFNELILLYRNMHPTEKKKIEAYIRGLSENVKREKTSSKPATLNEANFLNTFESSNDDSNVVNAPQEPIVFNQNPHEDSSQSPLQIDHQCCYGCGDRWTVSSVDDVLDRVSEIKNVVGNKQYKPDVQELFRKLLNDVQNIHVELAEYINIPSWNNPAFTSHDDDEENYTIAITPEEPDNSLSMRNEHLDTISATTSDEVIKSSVEDLVPIPSESEGIPDNTCDVPFRDNSPPLDVSED
uniref:Retrotransposon gag domain-containing protein n=1 Tax=Tanacetum cinerariifolium TaxID=118510 RepID=A0A6L2LT73_TANCI|nr:hypothetical protein [Tanacetum cinerariifolium]